MAKRKNFADDGWAIWVTGEDTSTFYLNEWVNPQGKSYVDVAIHIRGIKETKSLNMYFPFAVEKSEVEDVSLQFNDENLSRAIFSSMCLVDYKKNKATSEIAYNGKTVDVVHISTTDYQLDAVADGALICVDLDISSLTLCAAKRLMDHNLRVRKG